MVKKSIIAIVLMGMLATTSYAQLDIGGDGSLGAAKYDSCLWPATITITYTPVEICRIPIKIYVGMFIEIVNCGQLRQQGILLQQVNCTAPGQSFPCYKGCKTLQVRANFDAILTYKFYMINPGIVKPGKYKAFGDI